MKTFPQWNVYFRGKTYHKQNKEVTYVLCWVMIGTKKKRKEEKRRRKVEGMRTLQGDFEKRYERSAKPAVQAESPGSPRQ